ncbi:MAG: OmpA family protein [Gammaproteobacteria bacterium]
MKNHLKAAALLAGLALAGCATQSSNTYQSFQPNNITGQFKQKADNFLVIVDSSSTMAKTYEGGEFPSLSKFQVEKELLNRLNQSIPGLTLTAGIRTFGFGECSSFKFTEMKHGMESYSKSSFENGMSNLNCASGGSPMYSALNAAASDLSATTGDIAVIVFSDGLADKSPVPEARSLKSQYGDRLCIYTVWVGNSDEHAGHNLLRTVSDAGKCGFVTTASKVASPEGMADFVERVFLEPVDLPKDSDGDGVYDDQDQCPNTPKGATVNKIGCWVIKGINFDTDKSDIKPQYHSLLHQVISVFKNNPDLKAEIQGHTDNQGSAEYNIGLSDRRANSVMQYLVGHGVSADRLTAHGYGLTRPIDTNETAEGRANNRRVQLKPDAQ